MCMEKPNGQGPEQTATPPEAAGGYGGLGGSLIGSQIVSPALEALALGREQGAFGTALRVRLSDLAAAKPEPYPGLKRGMIVTVHRPWSTVLRSPLWAPVAWRIRHHEARILGHEATEHHAMIYAGNGKCWSQDLKFDLVSLEKYKGCVLTFWDPGWTGQESNKLMGECGVHRGDAYAGWDIAMILGWSLTGSRAFLSAQDRGHWICSESVCELARMIRAAMFGAGDCLAKVPQALADWLAAQDTTRLVIIPC